MTSGLVIRPALPEDINAMAELLSLIFKIEEDFSVDIGKQRCGLEMFLKYPTGRCLLVAEQNQKVIGMCSAQVLISTAEGGWKVLVEDVVVEEDGAGEGYRRQERNGDGLKALHRLHRADQHLEEEARHAEPEHVEADPAHALLGLEGHAHEGHEEAHEEADHGRGQEAQP